MSEADAPAATPREVAMMLAELGTLLELSGADSFRSRAFTRAARELEASDADLGALVREGKLTTLPGIGAGIAPIVREYVLTGRSTMQEELRAATPASLYELLRVPGLGPKRIHQLYSELGIQNLDDLEAAARDGRLEEVSGMGAKTAAKVLEGIGFARAARSLRRYPDALEIAVRIVEWLRSRAEVQQAEIAGAVRRRCEVVEQVDLVVSTADAGSVLDAFEALQGAGVDRDDAAGEATLTLSDGVRVRLRCASPSRFVSAMVWETGGQAHLTALAKVAAGRGAEIDRDGVRVGGKLVAAKREAKVYEALGLQYIEPELREGLGEVEAAARGLLPALVELEDLRGTFHCHTTASDGKATLREMAEAARAKGWSYLGIADHSQTAAYAGGLSIAEIRAQRREIDELNAEFRAPLRHPDGDSDLGQFRVFQGIESDILADGSLDYPDEILASFDYVVASVHSGFRMPPAEMTRRMVNAARHPRITILGHLTGRLLLRREGYELDVKKVLDAAAEAGTVIEINASPNRLDLDWRHVRRAAAMGILIAINPDAHSVRALDHVAFGINMARKAGLQPRQVLNTWPLDEVERYFAERKQSR